MNENHSAIEAVGVTFSYQEGTEALSNIDMDVKSGEFIAMLASNGSGKTTLLKVLIGLLKPQKGEVLINGKPAKSYKTAKLYQQIGLVLQNPNDQLFAPTVRLDVEFGPRNLGLDEEEIKHRTNRCLESVGAGHLADRAIHQLSFGEQKRVSLAGVLAMAPSILILDEPTAGLDPAGEAKMLHLLGRLNKEQKITIIMATHSVDMLPLFADRIYVLRKGKILSQGKPEVVFADHEMVSNASLRLPYISRLLHELQHLDGVPFEDLPLTMNEARQRIMQLIPPELIMETLTGKENE